MQEPQAIYICPGDPWNNPRGGQTAFAKQMLNAFGSKFAVVSPSEVGEAPIGRWFEGEWRGEPIWRFNIGSYAPKNKSRKPLIPRRVVFRRLIARNLSEIRKIPTRNLFCDSPEILGVLRKYEWSSFCYRFAGLNNPVGVSRYARLRFLAGLFHRYMISNLAGLRPDLLLASADSAQIAAFEEENRKLLGNFPLKQFPTRFDPNVYYPGDRELESNRLGWNGRYPRLTIVGRLCWVKGWKLALEAVSILRKRFPNVLLTFVGDGEDRASIEAEVKERRSTENVRFEGFLPPEQVRLRLVASDLYLVASHYEGWSVATTEALACGKVCVSTEVSGARDMIDDGVNGRIVGSREPSEYARAILEALELTSQERGGERASLEKSTRFSTETAAEELREFWAPLAKRSV